MLALGGAVRGGRVYGDWPGLAPEQLHEARDVALTSDFRDVFAEMVVAHIGLKDATAVFPGFAVSRKRFRGLIRAWYGHAPTHVESSRLDVRRRVRRDPGFDTSASLRRSPAG
jgi:hypothetical protein